jgi:hypothetical protein
VFALTRERRQGLGDGSATDTDTSQAVHTLLRLAKLCAEVVTAIVYP